MISDTIETPFHATRAGKAEMLKKLAPFGYNNETDKSLFTVLAPEDDETKPPVIAIIVYDPDKNYVADRICEAIGGKRLGYGPGQPASILW